MGVQGHTDIIGEIMETKPILLAFLPVVLAASGMTALPAKAQSQTPALGCYIDTSAFDYPSEGNCYGLVPPQRTIVFEVMYRQTPYSRYSYVWTGCTASGFFCTITNAGAGPGGEKSYTATVLITDNQTGLTYTRTATATLFR